MAQLAASEESRELLCVQAPLPTFWYADDASSQINQIQSPFLRLPPELRNRIYSLILHRATLRVTGSKRRRIPQRNHIERDNASLLRTCRQVYYEARTAHITRLRLPGYLNALPAMTCAFDITELKRLHTIEMSGGIMRELCFSSHRLDQNSIWSDRERVREYFTGLGRVEIDACFRDERLVEHLEEVIRKSFGVADLTVEYVWLNVQRDWPAEMRARRSYEKDCKWERKHRLLGHNR